MDDAEPDWSDPASLRAAAMRAFARASAMATAAAKFQRAQEQPKPEPPVNRIEQQLTAPVAETLDPNDEPFRVAQAHMRILAALEKERRWIAIGGTLTAAAISLTPRGK